MTIFEHVRVEQSGERVRKLHVSGGDFDRFHFAPTKARARMLCGRVLEAYVTDLKELPGLEPLVCKPCALALARRRAAA